MRPPSSGWCWITTPVGGEERIDRAGVIRGPTLTTYVFQPGPADGKDTCWGTVFAVGGCPDAPDLDVGGWGDWYYDYFEFNLGGAPPADQTVSASLQFYFSVSKFDPQLDVYRITEAWTEAGVSRAWKPSSVIYKSFGKPVVPAGYYSVDITDLYKQWKSGVVPNHGIKLVPRSNSNTNGVVAASENADAMRRPKLTVTYLKP